MILKGVLRRFSSFPGKDGKPVVKCAVEYMGGGVLLFLPAEKCPADGAEVSVECRVSHDGKGNTVKVRLVEGV